MRHLLSLELPNFS